MRDLTVSRLMWFKVRKKRHMFAFSMVVQRGKRGKSNYCREHKAIGRIIEGKIARERANSVDPSMSMYEEALRIQKLPSGSLLFDEMMKIIFYIIIIFFLLYIIVIMPIQGLVESFEDQRWYS